MMSDVSFDMPRSVWLRNEGKNILDNSRQGCLNDGHARKITWEPTKLVRLGFCDAAGLSSIQQEPFAVHTVMIVEGDHQWHQIDADVETLLDTLPSSIDRQKFEFHAGKLFQGDKDLPLEPHERRRLLSSFLELIPEYSLPFVCGIVDKVRTEELIKPQSVVQLGLTYEDMSFYYAIERLELWFRREQIDEKALLISDTSNVADTLEKCIQTFRKSSLPARVVELKFDHIVALPLFTSSHKSWGVQLADHASYFVKRERMGKANSHDLYSIIEPCLEDYREFPAMLPTI